MYNIPKDINAKPKLLGLEIKELMIFVIAIVMIFTVFKDMVHKIFSVPYYLLAIGTLFYSILPSTNNANRKNYHSFFYLFKKDKNIYKPIDITPEFNEEMEKEVEELNESFNVHLTEETIQKYSNEILKAKNKNDKRKDKMSDKNYESEDVVNNENSDMEYQKDDESVNDGNDGNNKKMGNPFRKMKKWQQGLISVAGLVVISLLLMGLTSVSTSNNEEETDDKSNTKQEIFFEEALKSASIKDYEHASVYLDKVDYDKLDKEEKNIMVRVYLFADQPEKSVTNQQEFDVDVANYYKELEDMETLNALASNEDIQTEEFEYVVALLDDNSQRLVDLKDDVKLTDDKKKEIVDAMIDLSEFNDAKKFIKDNDMSSEHEEKVNKAEQEQKEKERKDKKKKK